MFKGIVGEDALAVSHFVVVYHIAKLVHQKVCIYLVGLDRREIVYEPVIFKSFVDAELLFFQLIHHLVRGRAHSLCFACFGKVAHIYRVIQLFVQKCDIFEAKLVYWLEVELREGLSVSDTVKKGVDIAAHFLHKDKMSADYYVNAPKHLEYHAPCKSGCEVFEDRLIAFEEQPSEYKAYCRRSDEYYSKVHKMQMKAVISV